MAAGGPRPTLRAAVVQYVCPSRLLGTGYFGNVYKAEGPDKSQYAVKVSPLSNFSDKNDQCTLTEAVTLSQFAHMHVVKYLDCWEERDRQGARQLYLVMEYCQGRDLRHYLEKTLQHPPEEELFGCWLAQIASGLEHIHSHNVIHRNLKTSNVLVWCYRETVVLKIGGFGLSKGLKHFNDVARSVVGTANFMSPELLQGKKYDRKTDIWSFGCTAFEIATLRSPKPNPVSYIATYVKYSSFFKDLIRKMLMSDADCRPDADVILKVLAESGYTPHDGISSTSSVSTASSEPSSSLYPNCHMTPVFESRGRNSINSCEGTSSAKSSSQGIDVALNTFTLVRRAERDRKINNRNSRGTNSCEGTTSANPSSQGIDIALNTLTLARRAERDQQISNRNSINSREGTTSAKPSNQGIDVALNTLTLVRRAERDQQINGRNWKGTNSCEGTTSAKPSSQGIDVALKTDTLFRRDGREQQMKKTVTFAPSSSQLYSSSGSGYETDISSFGMSGSFIASPRSFFNAPEQHRHSNTEMSRGTNKNSDIETPETNNRTLYEREGCNSNRYPDTGRCEDITSNTDSGDSLTKTTSSGSGYETDYDTDRDMWINDQIATLQPDIARTIGREVFVALYPTLNIKDEGLFTLHLMDQLEDYDEEVCDKMKRLWRLEKEKRERDDER
ncbi:serine/threonine-protein kinase Nek4-like [Haliotis rubra]|uniref:serine/threonine-protein kinase Nek4-like n=1 Tax=Haliotis rubra TaxID=36100 RepID=UPI001EE507B9|nr:serine/threonine-protein kinase Nek4-like [Haliotis rubra]